MLRFLLVPIATSGLIVMGCADDWSNGGQNQFDPSALDSVDEGVTGATGESPYEGGWEIGDCQDEIEATVDLSGSALPKSRPGDVLFDFRLTDQFGDGVRLYDFCDRPMYLEWSALW